MTLPEHAICSLAIAQLGVANQMEKKGLLLVGLAGICPDLDSAAKLIAEEHFWRLHHALGHSLLSVLCISTTVSLIGSRFLERRHLPRLFACCLLAALAHCFTDSLYWWGVKPLWPFDQFEITFDILEYLDLFVLSIWLIPCFLAWRFPNRATQLSLTALCLFTAYVGLRSLLPEPTGTWKMLTGGWIYMAPNNTPVLDWW